jgi:type IV secretion system protein VirD4
MVSRQETARPLLTPGEVMQLPPADELVLVSGLPPIRAKKLRYYQDRNFTSRVLPPPDLDGGGSGGAGSGDGNDGGNGGVGGAAYHDRPAPRPDDWGGEVRGLHDGLIPAAEDEGAALDEDSEGGLQQQRHPGLEEQAETPSEREPELTPGDDDDGDPVADQRAMTGLGTVARAVAINEGKSRGDDLLPGFDGDE